MTTTTTTQTSLHAYLAYRDADAALDWLGRAFGFETVLRAPDDKGGVAHSELRLGEVAIIVFSDHEGYERPARKGETHGHGLYLHVDGTDAVDTLYASAVEAGATVVWTPGWTPWGNYRIRVLDPEGYEWTVGTYRPGEHHGED